MNESVTSDSRGTEPEQSRMRVLAVTSHRPEEVRNSVADTTAPTAVVTIEPSPGRVGHITATYRQTRDAIQRHDPDVILLDCFETMGAVVTALAERHDVPVVARLVGDAWTGFGNTTLGDAESVSELCRAGVHRACYELDRQIFDRADGFVTVSRELQQIATSRTNCPLERTGVVPVPLTTDTLEEGSQMAARQSLGIEEDRVVLTVTNLKFEEKLNGVRTTLQEIAPLLRNNSDLAYVVAGGGRHEEALRDEINRQFDERVRDQIYLPGYVDAVSDLYAVADIFVYVSYRDGYPNAVLEAQTAELPVVANAAHGMCDQITDRETGLLFDSDERGALRTCVATLLANPEMRRDLGVAARERVMRENTPEQVSHELEETLQRILSNIEYGSGL